MFCSIQMLNMTKLKRDDALLKHALELSQDTDRYIVFHCAGGDVVTRSIFPRLHSRLISSLVDSVPCSPGYSIMLPDVPRFQSDLGLCVLILRGFLIFYVFLNFWEFKFSFKCTKPYILNLTHNISWIFPLHLALTECLGLTCSTSSSSSLKGRATQARR